MSDPPPPSPPVHNILLTIPRTASNLLTKLLNLPSQTNVHRPSNNKDGYFFLSAVFARLKHKLTERPVSSWSSTDKQTFRAAHQSSFDELIKFLQEAEQVGRSTYVKEHVNWLLDPFAKSHGLDSEQEQSERTREFELTWNTDPVELEEVGEDISIENVTCLPTTFLLRRVRPTFLIRHPALTFPSSLRAMIDLEGLDSVITSERTQRWECTYAWTLSLYRLYMGVSSFDRATCIPDVQYPIILDASDLGNEKLVKRYVRAIGLDDKQVRFEWDVTAEEELEGQGKEERRMKSTLIASTGVEKGRLGGDDIDIGKLEDQWKEEFGTMLGNRLVKMVRDSMADYLLLRELRLRC